MKAIVQARYGSPDGLELRDVEKPVPGDDDILVRVRAASVNALDSHLMRRLPHLIGKALRMPSTNIRGVDLAGQVEAVGKNVTRFRPGDEVFGAGVGTFAEYALSTERRLASKPRNLPFDQAAAIPCAGLTALQGLRDYARVSAGQRVVVYGAGGGVGTLAVLVAKALGARVAAVSRTENMDLLRGLGADEVIDYTQEDFTARGKRYDVLYDVGADRSFADCRRALTPGGVHVLAGAPSRAWAVVGRLLTAQFLARFRGQRVGSFMARGKPEDLVALKEMAEAGKLTPAIDRRCPLAQVPDAIRYVSTRRARGKVVIDVG